MIRGFFAIALIFLSATACKKGSDTPPANAFSFTSGAFQHGGKIPAKYTCDGANVSPALSWSNAPGNTKSFAIIVVDKSASDFTHWVIYDIPATSTSLSEGIAKQETLPGPTRQGKNSFDKIGYDGPCPPSGSHRYIFKLYALDKMLGLSGGASKETIVNAINGHSLGTVEIEGNYK
jgi:Raf kinase inhibitor-like YbhB/YbcL family protein